MCTDNSIQARGSLKGLVSFVGLLLSFFMNIDDETLFPFDKRGERWDYNPSESLLFAVLRI